MIRAALLRCVERTLIDVADCESANTTERVWDVAEARLLIDFKALDAELRAAGKRRGAGRIRHLMVTKTAPSFWNDELERMFRDLMRDAGLPEPRSNELVPCRGEWLRPDFFWPELRLVIETDGWSWHRHRAAFEDDRRKRAMLAADGWMVVVYTSRRVQHDKAAVLAELCNLTRRAV